MINPHYLVHICRDSDALSRTAADFWLAQAVQAIGARGAFYAALTGGATPQPVYRLLARPEYAQQIDWRCVHVFIGDERYVAHDHPDSNFGMTRRCLLDHVPIPGQNIHPVPTDYPQAGQAAEQYAAVLRAVVPVSSDQQPLFDLIMLGMGDDGHTASLFPGTDILRVTDKPVAAVYVGKLANWRVSLTYPALNGARQIMVLVSGENKAAILAHVLREGSKPVYPIQGVLPAGEMHWFIDQAAAAGLDQSPS